MLPLARLEDEPKSGAIFVYLFISATLIYISFYRKPIALKNQGSTTIMQQTFQAIFHPVVYATLGFIVKTMRKQTRPR